MIKEVKLKSISFNEGTSKKGRPYTMVFIEVGETKASMYCDNEWNADKIQSAKSWKEGDKITLAFEQKGEYLNFDFPKKTDLLEDRIAKLEKAVFGN